MSTPRQLSKILNLANLETNTITASIDSDIVNQTVTLGVTLPVGTISVSSADTLPLSNIQIGQQGFVTTTNKLYIYNGSGWYNIATINSTPYWVTEANASYTLNTDGTATVVEINAADSDGTTVSYTATGDSNFNAIATVVQDSDGRFVIRSIDSDGSVSKTSGSGTLTFTATDGINQASVVSTFSLSFGPDWSVAPTETKIVSSDLEASDLFGQSVSISSDGTYAIVGAYAEDTGAGDAGAAYIFTRSGSTWTQQAKLLASDAEVNDFFGYSVSISSDGSYAIVGAYDEDAGGGNAGAAYIFSRSGSTWTQQAKLLASDIEGGDNFGLAVSISSDGTYAIVGARWEDTGGSEAGAAYIFSRSGSTWTQQQKITASDAQTYDYFGQAVSISSDGSYAIVGAWSKNTSTGAAYIFTRSGSTWTQQQKITASDAQTNDLFGWSVSINGNGSYVIVGARYKTSIAGAAYVFSRSGSTWTQQQKITASDAEANDQFGFAVSISSDGTYAIVSSYVEDTGGTDAGAAYIYGRSGSTWTQERKIQASDIQASDLFGTSVSMNSNGTYVIVGARLEDGGAGDPLGNAGAAYIYEAG